jgi:hypothetical protein
VFQVVVLPPAESTRDVEEFRRLHDPAFHRIGAHLVLVPPFDATEEAVVVRFDAMELRPAFDVAFGPPVANGHALALAVTGGAAALAALRGDVATALLPPHVERPDGAIALRAGLLGGDAELELARRALATLPPPEAFTVREVVLLLEDVRGLWHDVRRRRLPPP